MSTPGHKQEKLELATTVFLAMFFGTLFAALLNLDKNESELAAVLIVCALLFLGLTFLAYFKPQVSLVIGLILYTVLVIWLYYSFYDDFQNSRGARKLGSYLIVGFALIATALYNTINNKNKKSNQDKWWKDR